MMNKSERPTLVVVDDNPSSVNTACLSLSKECELIGVANTLSDGIEIILDLRPDVVLMAVETPGGSAYQATRLIAHKTKDETRVLLWTRSPEAGQLDQANQAGATGIASALSEEQTELGGILRYVAEGNGYLSMEWRDLWCAAQKP